MNDVINNDPAIRDTARTFDISPALELGRWTGYQKAILLMTALIIVFDGLDIQVIGLALPALIKDWSLPRTAFASVLAIGLFGMVAGTLIGGYCGDRFGRRATLISSMLVFGTLTACSALAHDIPTLGLLRFLAGLGLGGAVPNATTLASEFTPLKNRPLGVVLAITCIPVGGLVGGLLATFIIPAGGWQTLFVVAGLLPIVLAILLFFILPESPRYLVRFARHHAQLKRLLVRLGHVVPDAAVLVDQTVRAGRSSPAILFSSTYRNNTLVLWLAFFFCFVAIYAMLNWIPTVLFSGGLSQPVASTGITVISIGGIFGAIIGGWLMTRWGSKPVLLTLAAGVIVTALFLRTIEIAPHNTSLIITTLAVFGFFLNTLQTCLFPLAAYIYSSQIRATGMGGAVGVGRIGGVISSYGTAYVLQMGGSSAYFTMIAMAIGVNLIALLLLKKHIPKFTLQT